MCIEKDMHNLINAPCGTCDHLKFGKGILAKRCKNLSAKSSNSCVCFHSDLNASKIVSSQAESNSHVQRDSLDVGSCASASDSTSLASSKFFASSSAAQSDSCGKGASHIFETRTSKPIFQCTT